MLPLLVHRDGGQVVTRTDHLGDELVECVLGARERGNGSAERLEHRGGIRRREWIRRLHDRLPLLEPVVVRALEPLDVHQPVANLDGGVADTRQEIDLVALLHALGSERGETAVGLTELVAERPPLPARHDRGHHAPAAPRVFAKYSSALRVFVSCSPETSTPLPARNARTSAATWNASVVPQRVESSSTREPSG